MTGPGDGRGAVSRALAIARQLREEEEIIEAEIVDYGPMPAKKALILRGRAALADIGRNPDDWVDAETEQALRDAEPRNTVDAICWGWGRWLWWAGLPDVGVSHEPGKVRPGALRRYIQAHKTMTNSSGALRGRRGQPYAPQTVELAVYVIGMVHNRLGYANPVRDPRVRAQLDEYGKWWAGQGYLPDEASPITHAESVLIARTQNLNTVGGLRNAAAFRLLFDMGCRPAELLALLMSDVRWETPDRMVVTVRRSKTDQAGKRPRHVGVEADRRVDWDVDPVRLVTLWYQTLVAAGHTSGPLFPAVFSAPPRNDGRIAGSITGEHMTHQALEDAWNRATRAAGAKAWMDPVTGHRRKIRLYSNRSGMITALFDRGVRLEEIAKRTGHSPQSEAITRYIRSARRWGAANLGLLNRQPIAGDVEAEAELD